MNGNNFYIKIGDYYYSFNELFVGMTGATGNLTNYIYENQDVINLYQQGSGYFPTNYYTIKNGNVTDLQNIFKQFFSITGNSPTIQLVNNNTFYILTFTSGSSTLKFSNFNSINSLNMFIIVIGGGGGGGGGGSKIPLPFEDYSGGGGGAGSSYVLANVIANNNLSYTIQVGQKGLGGSGINSGTSGTNSSFSNGTNNIISYGANPGASNSNGYVGGSSINPSIYPTLVCTTYTGGNGGRGPSVFQTGNRGISSSLRSNFNGGFTQPSITISNNPFTQNYSGGGGGGGGSNPRIGNGGSSGNNGNGGLVGGNSSIPGQSATSYGSGGGGAGLFETSINKEYVGGNGGNGVVIIGFTNLFSNP